MRQPYIESAALSDTRKCYSIEVGEDKFYIGGLVLLKFIELVVMGSMNFSNTKLSM